MVNTVRPHFATIFISQLKKDNNCKMGDELFSMVGKNKIIFFTNTNI
jgi:hypothetical protein